MNGSNQWRLLTGLTDIYSRLSDQIDRSWFSLLAFKIIVRYSHMDRHQIDAYIMQEVVLLDLK